MEDLESPRLGPEEIHHLHRVLRLRPGEKVIAADGRGGTRPCVVPKGARWEGVLEAAGPVTVQPRGEPRVQVGFALLKGDRNAWVVQKLTELGVDRIVPVLAERSVKRPREASLQAGEADLLYERLVRVCRGAFCQARLAWLPSLERPVPLASLAAAEPVLIADAQGGNLQPNAPLIVVGPEGGWSAEERKLAKGAVRLGEHTLRSETAAVAAGTLLCALRGGIVLPNHQR